MLTAFFYNMLQTPSFLARDFEMCKRCINVGGITYDNAVKLNRMVCMLFEGYFKDVYENGIGGRADSGTCKTDGR